MHSPTWHDYAERESHRYFAPDEREAQQEVDRALEPEYRLDEANKALRRILVCVYCGDEVPDDHSPCCGEVGHVEAIEDDNENLFDLQN